MCEESEEDTEAEIFTTWGDKAFEAVDRAISLDPAYAKYYATKARLVALQGGYEEALALVHTAIDMEDSARPDYAIRLGEYQSRRLWIQARRSDRMFARQAQEAQRSLDTFHEELRGEIDKAAARIDESTLKNLEFLGFFAGLISFTIASVQITASHSFGEAARLIIVLTGGLLVAFAGFGAILEGSALQKGPLRAAAAIRMAIVAAAGAALILAAVLA